MLSYPRMHERKLFQKKLHNLVFLLQNQLNYIAFFHKLCYTGIKKGP